MKTAPAEAAPSSAETVLTLGRHGGLQVQVSDHGASWLSCRVPMPDGRSREVVLGADNPRARRAARAYLGVTAGRWANRLANAQVQVDGQIHELTANNGAHCLHGGPDGFGQRRWRIVDTGPLHATFSLHSPDGDQGFPGAVDALVRYQIGNGSRAEDLTLHIDFEATTTRATPLALTNHAYLNLDGLQAGVPATDVREHRLRLAATHFVPIDATLIPLGDALPVAGTDFDFMQGHRIAEQFLGSPQQMLAGGYDHAFVLAAAAHQGLTPAAELQSSDGRLSAHIYTDQPALQVYTDQHVAEAEVAHVADVAAAANAAEVIASVLTPRPRFSAIALEPGLPADTPNRPHWPWAAQAIARPGQTWRATMRWQFIPA